jgi:S1-C subfamily serine protease
VPTEIKILIGDDTEGLDARFIARDTELDLAWLQIKAPGGRQFAALDLPAAAQEAVKPRLGQRLLALGMMGRFFGQEALVSEGVVAGRTRKPRELIVVRGGLDTDPGLPVFTGIGQLIGFACLQQPDAEELAGSLANLAARGRGLLLPVATVARATQRAKEVQGSEEPETRPVPPADTEPPEEGEEPG